MQDLLNELKEKAGLTEEQSLQALHTIKEYIRSKVPPMMHGLIDNFLGDQFKANAAPKKSTTHNAKDDFMDKAEEVTKQAAEKIEDLAEEAKGEVEEFAKEASDKIDKWAEKAEEAAQEAISKLKDMLEEQKNKQMGKE